MTPDQHFQVLDAYLSRLSVASLRSILAAAERGQDGQLNHGLSEQLKRHNEMREVVHVAAASLSPHDLALIDRVIKNRQ
ncbi:hypothetical protein D3C85_955330 [compost metagenome]